MKEISLVEMLKSGVHFGHRTSKWHPQMAPYIFTVKNNVHIINLEKTKEQLELAMKMVADLTAAGKIILFVGTKKQAQPLVRSYAQECGMPSLSMRWIGGLFTNFKEVSGLGAKLTKLKADRESGALKKYTKKEQLGFDRDILRLEAMAGGIEQMTSLPDAVIIVDLKEEKTALREARRMRIPVIGVVDTNADPTAVDLAIPANDDATKSLDYILACLASAVNEGRQRMASAAMAADDAATLNLN